MMRIRPIAVADLPRLLQLAGEASYGLTTLPPDEDVLSKRVIASERAFSDAIERPGGETYLFVLEDAPAGQVQGICGIVSKVGGYEPFWAYQRQRQVHESPALNIRRELRVLQLVAEHNGPSEIGSLFCSPGFRKRGAGRLLSLVRFLFMADFRERFEDQVIAEMRGVVDEHGRAPFWEAVGRHFFGMEFPNADYLSMCDKHFIAELLPRHPLYVDLLPDEARDVIGDVHANTRPALAMLQSEGFVANGMVDIFEAGPVMACAVADVAAIRRSRVGVVRAVVDSIDADDELPLLLTNRRLDFRACLSSVLSKPGPAAETDGQDLTISAEAAAALEVKPGDSIRFASIKEPAA